MAKIDHQIVVNAPLRGEWMAPNTPGKSIPSHGTEQLGQKYAIDFIQTVSEKKGTVFYKGSTWQYYLLGVRLDDCLCWGQTVYAPCNARVIEACDGHNERKRVHLVGDMLAMIKNSFSLNVKNKDQGSPNQYLQPVLGNYVILECKDNVYALLAHLQKGSVRVSVGQHVLTGEALGSVGHSGNSTAPHLHFQIMDNSDLLSAHGIPFAFKSYQLYKQKGWRTVYNEIPSDTDRIRFQQE